LAFLRAAGCRLRAFVLFADKTKERNPGCKAVEMGWGGRLVGDIDILRVCHKIPSEQFCPGRHAKIVAQMF
jgi:hypothetical protein